MLQTNQTNENKTTSVVEIDLKKNEHKKLSLKSCQSFGSKKIKNIV